MEWAEFQRHLGHLSASQRERVKLGYDTGEKAHAGQKRKSGEPFYNHPIIVSSLLADMGADPDTIVAALLHDTLEDTDLKPEEIDKKFNGKVLELVQGVTKLSQSDFEEKPTLEEPIETIRKMFRLLSKDVRVMVIKLVDRLHNMRTVRFLKPDRQHAMARETFDVYVKIAKRLSMREFRNELEGLCLEVLEPDRFHKLEDQRSENQEIAPKLIKKLNQGMEEQGVDGLIKTIEHEQKSWPSLKKQLETESVARGIASINVAILVEDIGDCYRVLGALHQQWKREILSFNDYINTPKLNGYRSLHTIIILESGQRVQCRIRTPDMHEYALHGITRRCFDNEARGVMDYLPWTKRISPLTEDSTNWSQEFWDSLQTDILGDTIIIHGPGNEAVYLPDQSTALDGAFHLFGDNALRLRQLKVNGEEVELQTRLEDGDALDVTLQKSICVERDWLAWVNTGTSTARIRNTLSKTQSRNEKLLAGREMLQSLLNERKKGYIEELDEDEVLAQLSLLGYDSNEDVYIAMANGQLDPERVYSALFEPKECSTIDHKKLQHIYFSVETYTKQIFERVREVQQKHEEDIGSTQMHRNKNYVHFIWKGLLSQKKEYDIINDLAAAGVSQLRTITPSANAGFIASIVFIIIIWGLDPVLAKVILNNPYNVHPIDFTIIRQLGFFTVSLFHLYLPLNKTQGVHYYPIPWKDAMLWLGDLSFLLVGLTTYLSLQTLLPQDYITIAYASSVLVPLISPLIFMHKRSSLTSVWTIAVLAALLMLKPLDSSVTWGGLFMGLLLLASFSLFAICINEYRRRHHVAKRLPQLLFLISIISLVSSLFLVPFSTLQTVKPTLILGLFLYSIVMIGLPYHLFYKVLSTGWVRYLSKYFSATIILAVVGQVFFFNTLELASLIPFGIIATAAWLMDRHYSGSPGSTTAS